MLISRRKKMILSCCIWQMGFGKTLTKKETINLFFFFCYYCCFESTHAHLGKDKEKKKKKEKRD